MAEGKGFLLSGLNQTWYSPELNAVEMLLYIIPEYRQSTVAMRMIKVWEQYAKSRGAIQLRVGSTTGYRTETVVKLYERMGYTQTGVTLRKDI